MTRIISAFFIGFGAVILLLLASMLILPQLVSEDVYRARIEAAVSEASGQTVRLEGDLDLSVFPRLQARLGDVVVESPPGFAEEELARIGELRAGIALWPLLQRRVEVKEFILQSPQIHLHRRADGVANWETPGGAEEPAPAGGPLRAPGKGDADISLGELALRDANITYRDDNAGQTRQFNNVSADLDLPKLDAPLRLDATGSLDGEKVALDIRLGSLADFLNGLETALSGTVTTPFGAGSFDGQVPQGADFAFVGPIEGNLRALPRLADWAGIEISGIEAVETISVNAALDLSGSVIRLTNIDADLEGPALRASYGGVATLGDTVAFDGRVSFSSDDIDRLRGAAGLGDEDLPVAISTARVESAVKGSGERLTLSDAVIDLSGPHLVASITGRGAFDQELSFNGRASITSDNLRALAAGAGVELPPGDDIYRTMALSGDARGTLEAITFENARLSLDDLTASGSGKLALSGARPSLEGDFTTGELVLTPYAPANTAKGGSGGVEPWSEETFDLSFLDAMDARLALSAPGLVYGNVRLEQTALDVTIDDGEARVQLKELQGFGGKGRGFIDLEASADNLDWTASFSLEDVAARQLLGTIGRFDRVSGIGNTQVTLSANGMSQAAIMRSLNGSGDFRFLEGVIRGVDFPALVTSLETLLQGQLNLSAFGAEKETVFENAEGRITIVDGVTQLQNFVVKTETMRLPVSGEVDLAAQRFRLTFEPKLTQAVDGIDARAVDLPIPLMVSGGFNNVQFGIDTQRLQQLVAPRVRAEVRGEVDDAVRRELEKSDVGRALQGIIDERRGEPSGDGDTPTPSVEEQARGALGDLIRREVDRRTAPAIPPADENAEAPPADDEDRAKTDEERARETLNSALGGLFGRPRPDQNKPTEETGTTDSPGDEE